MFHEDLVAAGTGKTLGLQWVWVAHSSPLEHDEKHWAQRWWEDAGWLGDIIDIIVDN